jgi:natural product biosynthesis luciferase-like monooxygenase protein
MSAAPDLDTRALLKNAYLEIKGLRSQLAKKAEQAAEPVAVVGLGCRFPAGVVDAESFWAVLRGGIDAVREVPADRWDIDSLYDADPDAPGKVSTRHGAFLDRVDCFDAELFGISPVEAASMDPQQRLLLEVAWEALENAGISPEGLRGSATGVFVGMMYQDYLARQLRETGIDSIGPYLGTGSTFSAAAGRLSYVLGLQGPSIAIDTACSSSLVSLHLACQSLRSRECDLALAGGANVMLTPEATINLSKARMMSPTGRCRTFDASADGYIRGEGCGLVVLKRLSQARQDGDRILGLIRGSAVNQDGRSNGLTAPNGSAQRTLLREALKAAQASPEDIGYVECHGTGTPLGDPIEVGAILDVHGRRPADKPLAIGSVKTNFGHLESAAGICGFIKALLVLRHREVPPHLHLKTLNPHIKLDGQPVVIPTEPTPWFRQGQRLAAVSSFGFVGTNAHVILEGWEEAPVDGADDSAGGPQVLTLSAAGEPALRELAGRYAARLAEPGVKLAALCRSAHQGRAHLRHRLAVVADGADSMRLALAQPENHPGQVFQGIARPEQPARPVFLFTGQGSQYPGAGRGLYQTLPVFRAALDRCEALLRPHLERPLLAVLFAGPDTADARLLDETRYTQPALFALGYALFEQWRAFGVEPSALLGHSVGEYTAACAAGVFSLEDAIRLIAARSRLMQALPAGGGMVAVFAPLAWAEEAVAAHPRRLSIAAVNAPTEVVLSGALAELRQVLAQARQQGIHTSELAVSHAFHSPLMRPMLEAFRAELDRVAFQRPQWPLLSNLTGGPVGEDMGSPAYWLDHIVSPVQFQRSLEALKGGRENALLEIGPRPLLAALARRVLGDAVVGVPSLRKGEDEAGQIAKAAASLYAQGVAIDWAAFDGPGQYARQSLPTYPFQRERHWIKPADTRPASRRPAGHLLGDKLPQAAHQPDTHVWRVDAGRERRGYLWEHSLMGNFVWPISAQMELALAAAREALGLERCAITAFDFLQILYSLDPAMQQVQAVLVKTGEASAEFNLYSRFDAGDGVEHPWVHNSHARIQAETGPAWPAAWEPAHPDVREAPAAPAARRAALEFSMMFFAATEEANRENPYRLVLEGAKYADRAGFRSVWVPERHFTHMGSLYPNPSVLHAALARETERVRLMAGSLVMPLHNPIRVAEEWAMVDNLSGGRVGLAVASGWNPDDFVLAADKYEERYRHLYEGIEALRALWHGETWQAKGVGGKTVSLRTYPTPIQAEIPLWMTAARSPESFKKAGELGVNLLTHLLDQDIATLAEKIALYRDARARHGFDPEAGWVSVMCHTFLAGEADTVHRLARKPFCDYLKSSKPLLAALAYSRSKDIDIDRLSEQEIDAFVDFLYERFYGTRALIGTPVGSLDMVNKLHAAGVNEIACLLDFGPTTDQVLAHLPYLSQLREDYAAQAPAEAPRYAVAEIRPAYAKPAAAPRPSLDEARARCATPLSPVQFYRLLAERGVVFDGGLQGIAKLDLGENQALAEVRLPAGPGADGSAYVIHPVLLDACLQTALAALLGSAAGQADEERIFMPTRVGKMRVFRPAGQGPVWSYGRLTAQSPDGGLEGALTVFDPAGEVLFEMDGLQIKTLSPPKPAHAPAASTADWLYEVRWQAAEPAEPTDSGKPWLVLEDGLGVGRAWAARDGGTRLARAGAVTAFGAEGWTVNPDEADAFPRWLRQLDLAAYQGVLCLWPLDGGELGALEKLAVVSVVALAQALAEAPGAPKLWIATRGAQAVDAAPDALDLANAPLWGLAGALARELPGVWGGIVDLDPQAPAGQAAAELRHALAVAGGEDRLAVRGGQLWVQRLARSEAAPGPVAEVRFRPDGAYLIAGGLGGLSISTASWMAGRGAGHLVLLGRSPLPDADAEQAMAEGDPRRHALETIRQMRGQGASVDYVALDIADREQVAAYLERRAADPDAPPIRGFVHAAGIYRDEALIRLDSRLLQDSLRAKVLGAWTMHTLLPAELDCFVLYSSFSALTPPHGQAAYAAACAFLDALAWHRSRQGRAGLGINWGAWSEVGFAASDTGREAHARLEALGMRRMTPAQALSVLERLMGGAKTPPQIGVFPMDVGQMAQADAVLEHAPLLAGLGGGAAAGSASAEAFRRDLAAQSLAGQRDFLLQALRQIVADVLQLAPSKLKPETPLNQHGLDSLIAVHLKNRVQKETGFDIPLVSALNGASLASMADELMTEWRMDALRPAPEAAAGEQPHEEFEV